MSRRPERSSRLSSAAAPSRGTPVLAAVAIGVMTFVAYAPAMRGEFVWDDDGHVSQNAVLRDPAGLGKIWTRPGATQQYYPLVFTTFWLEYRLWGLNTLGYHLVNIGLHAGAAVLVWRVLRRIAVPGAWFAAAVFALHPVHVESVAWITERKNVLCAVFYFASGLAYLRWAGFGNEAASPARSARRGMPVASWVLFLLALFSKTIACVLPAVLLLVLWWKRDRVGRRDVLPLAPMFAVGLALGLLTAWFEKEYIGAVGAEWNLSPVQRVLIAGRALTFYAASLAAPYRLAFSYPRWDVDPKVWWQWLFPAAGVAVVIVLWSLRRRWGKAPLVAVLVFAGSLFPALGFFDVYPMRYSFVADHFQYLASVAPIACAAAGGQRLLGRRTAVTRNAVAAVVLGTLGWLTFQQCRIYRDPETLWRDTVRKNPASFLAQTNLGNLLARRGELNEAIACHRAAIALKPDDARAHYNLGVALLGRNELDEAIRHLRAAVQYDPDHADACNNLGHALSIAGRHAEAAQYLERSIVLKPDAPVALNNLAWLLATTREPGLANPRRAVELAERACALSGRPEADLLDTLAECYAASGRFADAARTVRMAIEAARAGGRTGFAESLAGRLAEYEAGRPASRPGG